MKTLIRLRGCAGWFEYSLSAHVRRSLLSRYGSYIYMPKDSSHILTSFLLCNVNCKKVAKYREIKKETINCATTRVIYENSIWISKISFHHSALVIHIEWTVTAQRTFSSVRFKHTIMKTYLNNFTPLKPHLYIAKMGFIRVEIICSYFCSNIDCGYSLEPSREKIDLVLVRTASMRQF